MPTPDLEHELTPETEALIRDIFAAERDPSAEGQLAAVQFDSSPGAPSDAPVWTVTDDNQVVPFSTHASI